MRSAFDSGAITRRKGRRRSAPAAVSLSCLRKLDDPNGPIYWKGKYHMFYQHNPKGAYPDTMHWGHGEGEDMVRWNCGPTVVNQERRDRLAGDELLDCCSIRERRGESRNRSGLVITNAPEGEALWLLLKG